jgi:amphiphysin
MTKSQMAIAETIDAFYGDAGAKDGVSRSYKQAVADLDAETIKALDGPYRTTVLDPISRFCAYFPDINECTRPRPPPKLYCSSPLISNRHKEAQSQTPRL